MNRIVALAWAVAAAVTGFYAISIALGPKADASGWVMAFVFGLGAGYCARRAWREAKATEAPVVGSDAPQQSPPPTSAADFPGAWRGDPVPLETQIEELKGAGLTLAADRTVDEMLTSWPRDQYETDPYLLILVMYGSEVAAEPWGRFFCECVWNFDAECMAEAGDYVRVFESILRITGQPKLATLMSDNFRFDAEACEIRYTINGRERVLKANVDNDWVDYEAVAAFVRDIETTIGNGRRFWAADNGQAAVLLFITDAEASKINALRADVLVRYAAE